tara:strand:- start:14643 stop:15254 length:612 start_codon:yes stop_codon:yes gene_type:complete
MGLPKVKPYEVYTTYLAIRQHFTSEKYDYHKYCGKVRSSLSSFYKNKNRFWFEKLSRKYNDEEIVQLFVSNFALSESFSNLWIGHMVRDGEEKYSEWKKSIQSRSYIFKQESEDLFSSHKVDEVFDTNNGHPILLKKYLSKDISLETLIIYDSIFGYVKDFDKKLKDPVWESVSIRIKKYFSFIHIDVFKYKKILKEVVIDGR